MGRYGALGRRHARGRGAGVRYTYALLAWLLLAGSGAVAPRPTYAGATPAPRAAPAVSARALAWSVAALRDEVARSPVLAVAARMRYERRLAALTTGAPLALGLEHRIASDAALLRLLDDQRAAAGAAVDRLRQDVRADLDAFRAGMDLVTAPVSVTAQSLAVTATVALRRARLDVQVRAARLALDVQVGARVLSLLTLNTGTRVDARRLTARLNVLAQQVRLGVSAVLDDLRVLARADPSAASDAQGGLAAGLSSALSTLTDTLVGTLDARESALRLDIVGLQRQETGILSAAGVDLAAVQHDVLADEVAAAPLSPALRRGLAATVVPAGGALRGAAAVSAQLAGRLADLGALQDAQARIDREVRKAQVDLDGLLARSDADLQGRLRADVTVAIRSTEQTVRVHINGIQVEALARDLDFNVRLGLSVLGIAALHAEVTPSTHTYHGSAAAQIQGVDLVLQARLQGLRARIRTDVGAVRAEQARLGNGVRARIAGLRSSLANVLAPLVARYQADVARLQAALGADLGAADAILGTARGRLAAVVRLEWVQGRVISGADAAVHVAPATSSRVVGWLPRGESLTLAGYVWGWAVTNARTGRPDTRWYILYDAHGPTRYLYVAGALLAVAPLA